MWEIIRHSRRKNLSSAKLTADELFKLVKCIYLELPVRSACVITGLSPKTVILWQKRAFSIAEAWINLARLKGKAWIDEAYFNFANGQATSKKRMSVRRQDSVFPMSVSASVMTNTERCFAGR